MPQEEKILPKKDEMTADILDVLENNVELKNKVLEEIGRKYSPEYNEINDKLDKLINPHNQDTHNHT